MQKTYRLWTFQSIHSIEVLKSKGILEASWDRYLQSGPFTRSYRWMVEQMADRKINFNNHAPIWAWHSCGNYENPPTLTDARCLLSDTALQDGIQTIEFECPVDVVVLSNYGVWNRMLDEFFYANNEAKIDKKTKNKLFETSREKFKKYDCIQATLPHLKLAWVKEIRTLNLKPGDHNFNAKEEV